MMTEKSIPYTRFWQKVQKKGGETRLYQALNSRLLRHLVSGLGFYCLYMQLARWERGEYPSDNPPWKSKGTSEQRKALVSFVWSRLFHRPPPRVSLFHRFFILFVPSPGLPTGYLILAGSLAVPCSCAIRYLSHARV